MNKRFNNFKKSKRGLSDVVTTVLLILLSIMAVGIVAAFVVPMVKNSLDDAKSCYDLNDYVKILDSANTCYNGNTNISLMISRSNDEKALYGIAVTISSGSETKRFDLVNGSKTANVAIFKNSGGFGNDPIILPTPGEARSFVFSYDGSGGKAGVAAIARPGKACSVSYLNIPSCLNIR